MRMACSMRRRGTGLISVRLVRRPPTRPFSVAWCHGAPGIALARMRGNPGLRIDRRAPGNRPDRPGHHAEGADDTLTLPRHDVTLCHGAAGLSEIVCTGGQWLGDASLVEAARAAGHALIDKYGATGSWPSGVASAGPNPSVMLGTARGRDALLATARSRHCSTLADRDRSKRIVAAGQSRIRVRLRRWVVSSTAREPISTLCPLADDSQYEPGAPRWKRVESSCSLSQINSLSRSICRCSRGRPARSDRRLADAPMGLSNALQVEPAATAYLDNASVERG